MKSLTKNVNTIHITLYERYSLATAYMCVEMIASLCCPSLRNNAVRLFNCMLQRTREHTHVLLYSSSMLSGCRRACLKQYTPLQEAHYCSICA
jgi:hypothetical protein